MSHRSLTRCAAALVRDIEERRREVLFLLLPKQDGPVNPGDLRVLADKLEAMHKGGERMLAEHGKR